MAITNLFLFESIFSIPQMYILFLYTQLLLVTKISQIGRLPRTKLGIVLATKKLLVKFALK